MSEYQYYEFVAVDEPISDEGLRYARGCSSRAQVSRVRWQNTYDFGDFHGSVDTLLKYYHAHFYITNWGTTRLGLAFPKSVFSKEAVKPYLRRGGDRYENTLTVKETGDRCIIYWERNDEDGGEWTEGEGVIGQLTGIREELMRGDYRALFLGWLADFYPDEWQDSEDGAANLPPIPAGLDKLSPALVTFLEHFRVDCDALAMAVELSQRSTAARIPVATVLEKFSGSEMRTLLARVAEGGGIGVMAELNRLTHPPVPAPTSRAIRCKDFAAQCIAARKVREAREAKAAAVAQQRQAKLRQEHLASIRQRADAIWASFEPLMDRKIASAYNQVATQLQELRDAYAQADDLRAFEQKLAGFRLRYSDRRAMLRRMEKM